jgi:hypothetical protein
MKRRGGGRKTPYGAAQQRHAAKNIHSRFAREMVPDAQTRDEPEDLLVLLRECRKLIPSRPDHVTPNVERAFKPVYDLAARIDRALATAQKKTRAAVTPECTEMVTNPMWVWSPRTR